jgi:glycosyltransferase involved in cell wall biosynthesis
LADQPDTEVVFFAFQNYKGQAIADRYINPKIKFIDAIELDPDSPKGFGDLAILPSIEREKPDILFIYNDISVCTSILKLTEGVKFRQTYIYLDIVYPWEDLERYEYLKTRVDQCFVFLECWKKHLVDDIGWKDTDVAVLPLGVDFEKFTYVDSKIAKREFGFEEDDFVVLNLNRNSYRKQWCTTIKAFMLFLKKRKMDPCVKLMCSCLLKTDDGYDIQKLIHTECKKLGVDCGDVLTKHIFFNPNALVSSESAINTLYNACDVGINTCCGEGFGLVNIEHASLGKPQVLAGVPAFKETRVGTIVEPKLWTTVSGFESHGGEIAHFDPQDFADILDVFYTYKATAHSEDIRTRFSWKRTHEVLDNELHLHARRVQPTHQYFLHPDTRS